MKEPKPEILLQTARKRKGLSQEDVANHLAMSTRMYQRYEEGAFPKYKSENIKKLDELLGTSLHDIIYEQKVPRGNLEGSSKGGSTSIGTLTEVKIPDAIQYLAERVTMIEAGMEVERSMLIDLLAQATGRSTMEISTEVAKALDYQIAKRLDEAKKHYI